MDFGHLVFDTPGGGDSALSNSEFDFYGSFLQTGDVDGGVEGLQLLPGHHYHHQQHHQQHQHHQHYHRQDQQQQQHHQHRNVQTDTDFDDSMDCLTSEESAASAVSGGSGLLPAPVPTTTGTVLSAYSLASADAMVPPSARNYAYNAEVAAPPRPPSILPSHSSMPVKALRRTAAMTRTTRTRAAAESTKMTSIGLSSMIRVPRTSHRSTADSTTPGDVGWPPPPPPMLLRFKTTNSDNGGGSGGGPGRRISATSTANKPADDLFSAPSPTSLSKRLERRGHTKSRQGCFNCKRRRIKCQETRPVCGHCLKTGLQCEYPAAPLVNHQPQHQIPLFSLQDMRFFQHFLMHCCPHHPLGNKSLWTHEIPCLSHNYDYLMHALLGMAASDLMQQDASLAAAAMDHRLKAIRAIKRALSSVSKQRSSATLCLQPGGAAAAKSANGVDGAGSNANSTSVTSSTSSSSSSFSSGAGAQPPQPPHLPPPAWDESTSGTGNPLFEEGNALLATCFALTFQSVELDDGMVEYMTFIRGILLVAIQMHVRGTRLLFRGLMDNQQAEVLRPPLEPMPPIASQWGEAAVEAVQALGSLCRGDEMAVGYHTLVLQMAKALLVSPVESYAAMTRHYVWWMQLSHEQFRQIIDLDRPVFVLLATHWIAIKQIMTRTTDAEYSYDSRPAEEQLSQQKRESQNARQGAGGNHDGGAMDMGILRWLKHLNRQVDADHQPYNVWPAWVEVQLDHEPQAFRRG